MLKSVQDWIKHELRGFHHESAERKILGELVPGDVFFKFDLAMKVTLNNCDY